MNVRSVLRSLGPGFITGASDDDPSGILTYAQTGAKFGYKQLWTTCLTLPFMIAVQEMCGRIGLATGKGLATVIGERYPKPVLWAAVGLLFFANAVNIGADLGAMAASAQLLMGLDFWLWLGMFTGLTITLEVLIPYPTYAKVLKWLTVSLFAYVVVALWVKQDWLAAAHSMLVPELDLTRDAFLNVVAVFGTTISPYLFFWQTDEEVEEEIVKGKITEAGSNVPSVSHAEIREMRFDTAAGMLMSNMIAFFIMLTAASTLHVAGITDIQTAADAAKALEPIAGPFAAWLFAAGVIGTGLLAVPVLAGSASYAVSETFGMKASLGKSWHQVPGFYAIIAVAVIVGALVNVLGIPPFRMLYLAAICNGITAPPLILLIVLLSRNKTVMGEHRSSWVSVTLGLLVAGFMGGCGVIALVW